MRGAGIGATAIRAEAPILLDITRSLSRIGFSTPTGIDRVETAYLRHVSARPFLALARLPGGVVLLSGADALGVLAEGPRAPLDLRGRWPRRAEGLRRAESLARRLALGRVPPAGLGALLARHRASIYLNVGHSNLSERVMAGLVGIPRFAMIHDTIPLDHPELSGPGAPARFAARLRAAATAEAILANSAHTAGRIRHWLGSWGLAVPPIEVLRLGVAPPSRHAVPAAVPHFVALGTVEPRKGHDLLLDVWAGLGPEPPALHVVGRMGWAGEALRRRLAAPPPGVIWHEALPDAEAASLLAGARALLMPSLAEGFGLPLAEALAMGVPAAVSDLPALRETGARAPLYLPPEDRAAWAAAIHALSEAGAPEHLRQLTERKHCRPIFWADHFDELERIQSKFRRV